METTSGGGGVRRGMGAGFLESFLGCFGDNGGVFVDLEVVDWCQDH